MTASYVSAEEFNQSGLADWRYILGAIEATFAADSFATGASFVAAIGPIADAQNHHPGVSLRWPGIVRLRLTTADMSGLTSNDTDMAAIISDLASDMGLESRPTTSERIEVAIDAMDINAIRPFWAAALGYVEGSADPEGMIYDLADPDGLGPGVWFQQMDAPRTERNNIHFDVSVPHDDAEGRVAAALAAGGTLVSDERAKAFWVLADAEGNEVCICTWQDRG